MIDEKKALKVKRFLETYCIQNTPPFYGIPLKILDWQWRDIILPLYGTVDEQGKRIYKKMTCVTQKKVGKTTLEAGLALYHLIERKGANIAIVASNAAQAGILLNTAADMIDLGPLGKEEYDGKPRFWPRRNINTIEDRKTKSKIIAYSGTENKSGPNLSVCICDEVCDWAPYNGRLLFSKLKYAGSSQQERLFIILTNPSFSMESLCYEQYQYAKEVKEGKIKDPELLPVLYGVPLDEDWADEKNWWKYLPSIREEDGEGEGTLYRDEYRAAYQEVLNNPTEETAFRVLKLGQFQSGIQSWISGHQYDKVSKPIKEEDYWHSDCVLGIDAARKNDLCSYSILIKREDKIIVFPRFFVPTQLAKQKEKKDGVRYSTWIKNGHVIGVDGDTIKSEDVLKQIQIDASHFRISEVRYDSWGMDELAEKIRAEGYDAFAVAQSFAGMSASTNRLELLIREQRILIQDNPCLRWCVSNAVVKLDHDRVMLDKARSTNRIDGVVALIIGLTYFLQDDEALGQWGGDWFSAG